MFIHIGENEYVNLDDVILIIDVHSGLASKYTMDSLERIEKEAEVIHLFSNHEKEKSIVIVGKRCKKSNKQKNLKVYYTSISSNTLYKRYKHMEETSFEMEVI